MELSEKNLHTIQVDMQTALDNYNDYKDRRDIKNAEYCRGYLLGMIRFANIIGYYAIAGRNKRVEITKID